VVLCRLSAVTVTHFTALGSQFIAKLKFRDMWAFVGQQGIKGSSPIEQVPRFFGPDLPTNSVCASFRFC